MIGKLAKKGQMDLFRPQLEDFIDPNHELVLLSKISIGHILKMSFLLITREKEPLRSDCLMVGCLMLKASV